MSWWCSRPPTSWRASTEPLQPTTSRHRCSATTERCSPRRLGVVAARWRLETAALGISYRHSTPYHPQTCGKVERFHQTEKKWLAKHAPAADIGELQAQIDRFVAYYNEIRPHRALGRRTPAQAFTARPKARPMLPGFVVPPHYRIRRDKVDITGVITLRHNSRLHHIGLGRKLTGTRVLVLVADLHVRVLTEDGELLRDLTLDPSHDYQPHGR